MICETHLLGPLGRQWISKMCDISCHLSRSLAFMLTTRVSSAGRPNERTENDSGFSLLHLEGTPMLIVVRAAQPRNKPRQRKRPHDRPVLKMSVSKHLVYTIWNKKGGGRIGAPGFGQNNASLTAAPPNACSDTRPTRFLENRIG